jgi:hypothetical protein|tara:strand:+ start:1267 stop:2082 length:816 start_codon:yes stop_codon:yes gene_type:complete
MTDTKSISIQYIDGPEARDDNANIKGRKNFRIKDNGGSPYLVKPTIPLGDVMDLDCQLEVGKKYKVSVNTDQHGNVYINDAEELGEGGNDIPFPGDKGYAFTPTHDEKRTRSIICQSIIKACAAKNGEITQADSWLRWHDDQVKSLSLEKQEAVVKETFPDSTITAVTTTVTVNARIDDDFNFIIDDAMWTTQTNEIIKVIEGTIKGLEDFDMNGETDAPPPLRSLDALKNWWRKQASALKPLQKKDKKMFQSFLERAQSLKEKFDEFPAL